MNVNLIFGNAILVLSLMTVLWVVSVFRRDASIVDPWWSMSFLLVVAHSALFKPISPTKMIFLAMVAVWAVRLWLHLLWRSRGKAEDPRYAGFRQRYGPKRYWWFSYFQVFLLQGILVLFISWPLVLIAVDETNSSPSLNMWFGFILFLLGFGLEAIADGQLHSFRANTKNKGAVLNRGLWKFSRHPNYFGEALLWWGFWLCAINQPLGWLSIFSPLAMTFLLVKVSGVSMLDEHLSKTKPGYAEYIQRTPSFIPWRPRTTS